jgi:LacI family transcriptional regulator
LSFSSSSLSCRKAMAIRQKRILLALGWYDYRLHSGIAKYAQEHDWHLCSDVTREKVIPWGWEGDGILAWLGVGDDLAEFVVHARKPTVDFSLRRPQLPFPRVLPDHAAVARIAAEQFLSHGLKNFVFYSDHDNWAYEETGQAFCACLEEAGCLATWLRWRKRTGFDIDRLEWKHKRNWLIAQMKQAPKPLAVLAATDDHAMDVLEACENADLQVPEQISIIGVDNSLLAVDAMRTPISSVDTNMELVGYRGAELLDRLMQGQAAPAQPLRVPPLGLIARKSSDMLAMSHPSVARSLRFIWEHFNEPISVKDLVDAAGMSRRGLYTAFIEHVGRSPGEELHRVRINHAKALLAKEDQKMESLAKLCGYQSVTGFWVAFKQSTGMSPKQYRDSVRS